MYGSVNRIITNQASPLFVPSRLEESVMNNSSQKTRRKALTYLLASVGMCDAFAQDTATNPANPAKPNQPDKKPTPSKNSRTSKDKPASKDKAMPEKKVAFPDSPYDMWQSAKKLLDLNNIVMTAKAIEEAFGFKFDVVDKERGRDSFGSPTFYEYKVNSPSLGFVKISAWERKDQIRWGVSWVKKNCDVPMRRAEPETMATDLSLLGWKHDKKDPPIGKTNSDRTILEFFPIDRKRFESPHSRIELPTQVELTFPSHNEECLVEIYALISKVN